MRTVGRAVWAVVSYDGGAPLSLFLSLLLAWAFQALLGRYP